MQGDIADQERRARGARGLRRDRQLRGRVARRPLDRRAGPLHPDRRVRHLRAARGGPRAPGIERYLQVSTDEVYGSIEDGLVHRAAARSTPPPRTRPPRPAATCSCRAYYHTYGMDAIVCRASNNYGPYQFPEKLIPLCVLNALHGDPLPVYGDGMQVRDWLYVTDHCRGIDVVLRAGKAGEIYNIGGPDELPNIDVVRTILELTGARRVADPVRDRPPRPRPPLLARARRRRRPSWAGRPQVAVRGGPRGDGRVVPRATPGGGSRSAPATTATTTSASTARSCAREPMRFQRARDPDRRARARAAEGDHRRPRVLLRDLPPQRVRRARHRRRRSCRTTTRARCAGRSARCTSSSSRARRS